VDFVFAVDSSADTQNWPNGTSFVATYQKYLLNATSDVVFPYIPDQQTYLTLSIVVLISGLSISDSIQNPPFSDVTPVISRRTVVRLRL
jgi:hypothetical protein